MSDFFDGIGPIVQRDTIAMLLGERLGSGIGREVYVFALDETKVIKLENGSRSFQNMLEWELWQSLEDTPHAKWLAPCRHISPTGIVLIQDRTEPLRKGDGPKLMPRWLCDFKLENYGKLNGRTVCHDYGWRWILRAGVDKRMSKVKWTE